MSPSALGGSKFLLAAVGVWILSAVTPVSAQTRTYTLDADFDEGILVNVNHDFPNNDQLQLNEETSTFPFINIAASARGTIVRIDVNTGQILGEYRTAPLGRGLNPSRTTVDAAGNVWAGNRDEDGGGLGSVVKVGLVVGGTRVNADGTPNPNGEYLAPPFAYNTCVDRDLDGLIKTSRGLGDILAWPDITDGAGGVTALVEDADDECILVYQRVQGDFVRHVSVDGNDNIWCAGNFGSDNAFDLLDGSTGQILASFDVGAGGYGGLVDGSGVLWSANRGPGSFTVLRYDTKSTIPTGDDTWSFLDSPNPYGLGIDSNAHIWNAQWTDNQIREFAPDGSLLNIYGTGGASNDRGVAVTSADDHVWVANSGGSDVSRLAPDGTVVKVIPLGANGNTPTGVAVDANGMVWATCLDSDTAKRIDPAGGGDGLGAVNLTVDLGAGAGPYNYSDMTGAVLFTALQQGSWTVVFDGGNPGIQWGNVNWNLEPQGAEPPGTSISVEVRAADAIVDLASEIFQGVSNGVDFAGVAGQYIEIQTTLARDPGVEETPVLSDLTVRTLVREVAFDIHPTSCPNPLNTRKNGVVPAALLGTDDFDVSNVDVYSLLLEGVPPIRTNIEDVTTPVIDGEECECTTEGPDGFDDLTMKFDAQELVAALGEVMDREERPLTLTGTLLDGTPIAGSDCVIILIPGQIPPAVEVEYVEPGRTRVSWTDPEDGGFLHYAVYRGTDPDFVPESPQDHYATTLDPFFVDINVPEGMHYYRVGVFGEPLIIVTLGTEEVCHVFSGYSEPGAPGATGAPGIVPGTFELSLLGSVPNPFRTTTRIVYTLPERMTVRLSVYDVAGRLVDCLIDEAQPPGQHIVPWDARGLASGTYFYRLEAGADVLAKRVGLVR
jgi:streptogramin lyase